MPIIDIHTHCSPPRPPGDRFGVQEALRGTPVGRNAITNYRGLPAVSYYEMGDFELQQEACATVLWSKSHDRSSCELIALFTITSASARILFRCASL